MSTTTLALLGLVIAWLLCLLAVFFGGARLTPLPVFLPGLEGDAYIVWWGHRWVKPHHGKWRKG